MLQEQDDWSWFRDHRERCYRLRIATAEEIARLGSDNGMPGYSMHAVSRIDRQAMKIAVFLIVLLIGTELSEDEASALWNTAAFLPTAPERVTLQ